MLKNNPKQTLLGQSPQDMKRLIELARADKNLAGRRPGQDDVEDFLAHGGETLARELFVLSTLNSDTCRMLRLARNENPGRVKGQALRRWRTASSVYLPPAFAGGLQGLRATMAEVQEGQTEFTLTVWFVPFSFKQGMRMMLGLLRHPNGEEFALLAGKNRLELLPGVPALMFGLFEVLLQSDDELTAEALQRADAELIESRAAVETRMRDADLAPLSTQHWDHLREWATAEAVWKPVLRRFAMAHCTPLEFETTAALHLLVTRVQRHLETIRTDHASQNEELRKRFDKRTRRMQADMEKLRVLTSGVRTRAERAEAQNQALAAQVRELCARSSAAPNAAAGQAVASPKSDVGLALDALLMPVEGSGAA